MGNPHQALGRYPSVMSLGVLLLKEKTIPNLLPGGVFNGGMDGVGVEVVVLLFCACFEFEAFAFAVERSS